MRIANSARKYSHVDKPRTLLRSRSLSSILWYLGTFVRARIKRMGFCCECYASSPYAASTRKRVARNPDKSLLRGARIPVHENYPRLRLGTFPSSFPSQADTGDWDNTTVTESRWHMLVGKFESNLKSLSFEACVGQRSRRQISVHILRRWSSRSHSATRMRVCRQADKFGEIASLVWAFSGASLF